MKDWDFHVEARSPELKKFINNSAKHFIEMGIVPTREQIYDYITADRWFKANVYDGTRCNLKQRGWSCMSLRDVCDNIQDQCSYVASDFDESKEVSEMKLKIREDYDHESTYYAESYYDSDFRGLEDDFNSNDFSEVFDWIWEKLNKGGFVWVTDNVSGQNAKLVLPEDDEYYDYIDPNDCIIWSSKYGENIDLNTNLYDLLK